MRIGDRLILFIMILGSYLVVRTETVGPSLPLDDPPVEDLFPPPDKFDPFDTPSPYPSIPPPPLPDEIKVV